MMKRFRDLKDSPLFPKAVFLLDHFTCQLVKQMQTCMCQSSPERTGVAGHGPREVLRAEECLGQHKKQISAFPAYMGGTPVRADDLAA